VVVRRMWVLIALIGIAACGPDLPRPVALEKVAASDNQTAVASARLPTPLAVVVTADDGTRAVRAEVRWTVTQGAEAVLSDTVTVSDGLGEAQVWLTLGALEGVYRVQAQLVRARNQTVEFAAIAQAGVQLSGVTPSTFTAGENLTLTGARFTTSTTVRVGGKVADVVAVGALGQSMAATVPPCLAPGPVQVIAYENGGASAPVAGTYQASSAEVVLEVGEYITVPANALAGCAEFPAVAGDTAEYLVMPQSVARVGDHVATFTLESDFTTNVISARTRSMRGRSHAERFHDWLRAVEDSVARLPKPAVAEPDLAPAQAVAIGQRRQFTVCASVTCSADEDFPTVTAEVRYAGTHAVIYEDLGTVARLDSNAVATLGKLFDEHLYEVASRAFGAESDVDRNGVTFILITPKVNGLTPRAKCSESIIVGFFYPPDLDPAFRGSRYSNDAEVFYSLAPDPTGASGGCDVPVSRMENLVPVTFIHELQHMISYNQHVLLRGSGREALWLGEGMSHIAEELGGRRFLELGDDVRFSRMVIGDVFNAYTYLQATEGFRLIADTGFASLEERGAAWLFLRWLADQYGESVIRRLSESGVSGATNVERATGAPFADLLTEWFAALYVSDLADFPAPARLQYTSWRFRRTWAGLNESDPENFPVPFPIEPPRLTAGNLSAEVSLRSGSGGHYVVVQEPGASGFTLSLVHLGGGSPPQAVVPHVSIVRLR